MKTDVILTVRRIRKTTKDKYFPMLLFDRDALLFKSGKDEFVWPIPPGANPTEYVNEGMSAWRSHLSAWQGKATP